MKFSRPEADVFIPAGDRRAETALARVTHLCVAAHQDDIEIMAHAGICDCLERPEHRAFGGVVVTNGAGCPRAGAYAAVSDEQMQAIRREEQRRAAALGGYALQVQLAHPSSAVKQRGHAGVAADLDLIFQGCQPAVVYLHNPADKHDTHIGVLARCLEALRRLPAERRPKQVLGCEVWRDLDWLADEDKVALDSGRRGELAAELLRAFASQVSGKRYDLATLGRRSANATFHTAQATDRMAGITWAIDLAPLLDDASLSLGSLAARHIDRFRADVMERIGRFA